MSSKKGIDMKKKTDSDNSNYYELTRCVPLSAPTPALGWTAVYQNGEAAIEDMIVGWVLCRVFLDRHSRADDSIIATASTGNEVFGLVSTGEGLVPPESFSRFRGYRHESTSLEEFKKRFFLTEKRGEGPEVVSVNKNASNCGN